MTGEDRARLTAVLLRVFDADDAIEDLEELLEGDETPALHALRHARLDAMGAAVEAGVSYEILGRIIGSSPETIREALRRRRQRQAVRDLRGAAR